MRRTLPLAAAVAILLTAPASALDLPARKAGLWEIKMSFEGRNILPQASQHCIDAETDKLMNSIGAARRGENCSKQDMRRVGGEIIVDSVCKFGDATTTSHAVVSGDFNSAYSVKVSSKREGGRPLPGMPADGVTNMTINAKWLGACKPDQKPGDMIMAGGRKINIHDLQNIPGMPK
jgi:hypothetical protein